MCRTNWLRLDKLQQPLITRRGSVVKLVQHHKIVEIRCDSLPEHLRVEALNRDEEMLQALRFELAHKQVSEVMVAKHHAETGEALLEDFLTVSDEQKPSPTELPGVVLLAPEPSVVERRDDRLAGAGSGDDEVAESPMNNALRR